MSLIAMYLGPKLLFGHLSPAICLHPFVSLLQTSAHGLLDEPKELINQLRRKKKVGRC
jgi:hypothetical protein